MKSLKNNQSGFTQPLKHGVEFRLSRAGFTLIELLVVIIIVAVLAAVGIPLMTSNVEKAKLTEAVAGLSTIRTLERAKLAEKGSYPASIDQHFTFFGMKTGDLLGRFFDDGNYTLKAFDTTSGSGAAAVTTHGFCAGVVGGTTPKNADLTNVNAPANSQVTGLTRSMDHNGAIYDDSVCAGNILNG